MIRIGSTGWVATASEWTSGDAVLGLGEFGIESDTGKWKHGNGVAPWAGLAYTATAFGLSMLAAADQAAAQTLIGSIAGPQGPAGIYDPITAGISTIPRYLGQIQASLTLTSGAVRLVYKTADADVTVSNLTARCGSSSTPSGITLCRFGIYSVDGSGDLTLIGSTPNDTSLLETISTVYTKGLSVATPLTAGSRYAFAIIQVASTAATVSGATADAAELAVAPRVTASLGSQSDLPPTIAHAGLSTSTNVFYMRGS